MFLNQMGRNRTELLMGRGWGPGVCEPLGRCPPSLFVLVGVMPHYYNDSLSLTCNSSPLGGTMSVTLYRWSLSTQLEQILENKVIEWDLSCNRRNKRAASLGKQKSGGLWNTPKVALFCTDLKSPTSHLIPIPSDLAQV